jgi:solute carrier family 25 2-oxodicarboxylate transporter 21
MVKTRHQLNHSSNENVYNSLKCLYKEGGLLRFYRGMGAEVLGIIPKSSGMYASYELVKRKCDKIPGLENSSLSAYMGGFASGIPESLIVTPTQVIKVRLQAKEHLGRYTGLMDCVSTTLRTEGLLAFYTGLSPTLYRNCIWNTVYFGTMHWLKQKLPTPSSKFIDVMQTLLTGFSGAVFATCFNAPFDVSKLSYEEMNMICYCADYILFIPLG